MNQMKKSLFSAVLLLSTAAVSAATVNHGSFFLGHNGGIAGDSLLEQAGRAHRVDGDAFYASFSVHGEYNSAFNTEKVGKYLTMKDSASFRIGAAALATTSTTDVMNTYFLLDETYDATITFKPKSTVFTTSLDGFICLGDFVNNLWLDVSLPLVHNKREVVITEVQNTAAANAVFAADTFSNVGGEAVPYTSFVQAIVGDKTATGGGGFVATDNLKYGKLNGSQSSFKVGDCKIALGYDFVNRENAHLGVALLGLLNGGGKPDAVYMFAPTFGTQGRHGVGGRIDGHVNLYDNDDSNFAAFLKADVVHLFDATQLRSYDVTRHGVWSRYMMYKEFATAGAAGTNLTHGVNFTTLDAKIGIDVMYEANLLFRYTNGNMAIDLGYGIWGHSKEEHKEWVSAEISKVYGALDFGGANMDTGVAATVTTFTTDATISGGTSAKIASAGAALVVNTATNGITRAMLNTASALHPSAMTHHVYGNLGYTWRDSEWEPALAVGGGAEFSGKDNNALNQWGVHLSGAVSF